MSANNLWWRLIERKRELGIDQEEAGRRCGVSQVTYGRWENQKRVPDDEHLDAIARFLGVTRADVVLWRSGEDRDDVVTDEVREMRERMADLAEEIRLLRREPPGAPPGPSS